jgi:histidinol-phosphatase (PHP family)
MWTNYHCHTNYCDGKKPVADVVAEAENRQMLAIGISSHAPLPFESSWCMKKEAFKDYLRDIHQQRLSRKIQVYSGLEVDFIPGEISPNDFKDKLDYTVGSVHFVEQHWEIDNTSQVFENGLQNIFRGDIKAAITRYFELTREMIATVPPNIVGHMDKIKMHNRDDKYFSESDPWYREQIIATLEAIAKHEVIVEVNTRGIYQKKTDTTYPSPWVLKEIFERGIPITLSSDAHHPDDLVNHFPETAKALAEIGFKKIRILLDGRWVDVSFTENGISETTIKYYPMA